MEYLLVILSIIIFIRTLSYGIYEIKSKNKIGGIIVIVFSFICISFPNIMVLINGA